MLIAFGAVALFIAWIWVDYFRLIDLYHKNDLFYISIAFFLGILSTQLIDVVYYYWLQHINFDLNGNFINDFLYAFIKVGALEEAVKILAFLLFYTIFKKHFHEPLDYLFYISVVALGFSAFENVLYFDDKGAGLIIGRSILSSVGHMFDTSIFGYGLVLYLFRKKTFWVIPAGYLLAALSHGIYDFGLMWEPLGILGYLITLAYFLMTISLYTIFLNNAINNSPHFSYKHGIDSWLVTKRMLVYYLVVFALQIIFEIIESDSEFTLLHLVLPFAFNIFIILMTVGRLSRFKLIKGRWEKLKFQLPFEVNTSDGSRLKLRGETFNDKELSAFFETHFYIIPIKGKDYYSDRKLAFMSEKLISKNDQIYYRIHIEEAGNTSEFLIQSKMTEPNLVNNKYPVVHLYQVAHKSDGGQRKGLRSIGWYYIKSF